MTKVRKIYHLDQETDDFLEEIKHGIRMKTGKTVGKGRVIDVIMADTPAGKKRIMKRMLKRRW